MFRQALLAAVAISYIICVLVMSGMQKEDLDVSLLRKLQRYNVNIGDMDNEKVRRECSTRKEGLINVKENKNDMILISTTERTFTSSTGNALNVLDIEAVLRYYKSQRKTSMKFIQTTTDKHVNIEKEVTPENEYFEEQPKINFNLLKKYIQLPANNISDGMNYDVQIENFYPKNLKDVELIDNDFKGTIMKKEIPPTTTKYTTSADPIIQYIYKQINDLLATGSNVSIITENESDRFRNVSEIYNKLNDTTEGILKGTKTEQIFDKVNTQTKSFYDFFNVINQFRTYSSIVFNQNNTPILSNDYKTELELPLVSIVKPKKNLKYYEEITTNEPETKLEVKEKIIPPNLIQEIAKSVKNALIIDLRKELSDIYIKTTQSTTITTSTKATTEGSTTKFNRIDSKEKTIMEAFMELYNKIKILNQTTFGPKEQKIFEPRFSISQKLKMSPLLPTIGKGPQVDSMFLPIFDEYKDQQTVFSSDDYHNRNQFLNIHSYHPRQIKKHQSPITIQTNSVEIKPLVVPVTKPESLIRQNIIVSRSRKDIVQSKEDHLEDIITKQNGYLDVRANRYNSRHQHNPYNSSPYGYQEPADRDDIIRFRMRNNGNSKLDTDYYEKINFDTYNFDKNRGLEYDHVIPRFHKRWENNNDRISAVYGNDNMDTDNRYQTTFKGDGTKKPLIDDILSRNQMSLIDMKKGSSYDDTHFKNFLKSQQKVTDILERILAHKPKTNVPPVVEIT